MWGPGILCPTIKAFFFSPLIARRILSPTLPTPVLLYTWIHFGGRWYGAFPKALLSTTRTRVSFCIARHAPLTLKCRWRTVLLRWVNENPNLLCKRAIRILVSCPQRHRGPPPASSWCGYLQHSQAPLAKGPSWEHLPNNELLQTAFSFSASSCRGWSSWAASLGTSGRACTLDPDVWLIILPLLLLQQSVGWSWQVYANSCAVD